MAWFYVLIAGVFEIVWAVSLKYTKGFTIVFPSIVTAIAMLASIFFLAIALKTIPVGTAYAVWTGIGAVGTAIMGILLFKESTEVLRIVCIFLVIVGIVGLKISSSH